MPTPPGPKGFRRALTRERILDAAMTLADERGLEGVTMRALARAVGVEAMSLYHHVTNRDEIVDGIVDRVLGEIDLPSVEGDWKSSIRACVISAHTVLRRHSWACGPLMSAARTLPARIAMIDALLARLEDAGLPAPVADLTYHALDAHILGSTMWEAGYGSEPSVTGEALSEFLESVHIEAFPHLAEHVRYHLAPRAEGEPSEFEFMLDLILDGADRLRRTPTSERR